MTAVTISGDPSTWIIGASGAHELVLAVVCAPSVPRTMKRRSVRRSGPGPGLSTHAGSQRIHASLVITGSAEAEFGRAQTAESVWVRGSWGLRHCLSKGLFGRSVPPVRLSVEPADAPRGVLSFE